MRYDFEQHGKEVERELLGTLKEAKEKREEREIISQLLEQEKMLFFDAAMAYVKERQSFNPVNPDRPFANFLRKHVFDILDLEDDKALKFYTALSPDPDKETVLDRDFGVDGFLELAVGDKQIPVTIDLTTNPEKVSAKADIVAYIPDDFPIQARFEKKQMTGVSDAEFEIFNKYAEELAEKVATKFKKLLVK